MSTELPRPEQLDLAEVITMLAAEDPDKVMPIGFHLPHSYRGYYNELAFEIASDVRVGDVLDAARAANGATYQGWKGGDYTMDSDTEVWLVQEEGCSGEPIGRVLMTVLLAQSTVSAPSPTGGMRT